MLYFFNKKINEKTLVLYLIALMMFASTILLSMIFSTSAQAQLGAPPCESGAWRIGDGCYREEPPCPSGTILYGNSGLLGGGDPNCISHQEAQEIIALHESTTDTGNDDCNVEPGESLNPENCGIIRYIRIFTDALSVIVGIVVVMSLVIAGIQYSAAGSNPQAVAAAKKRIGQALLALVIYLFLFAFLQWLVPGGVI